MYFPICQAIALKWSLSPAVLHSPEFLATVQNQLNEAFRKCNQPLGRCTRDADRDAHRHKNNSHPFFFHVCLPSQITHGLGESPVSLSLSPLTSHSTDLLCQATCRARGCNCTRLLSWIAHKHWHCERSDRAVIGGTISTLTGTLCADTAMLSGWAITFTQRSMSVAKRKVSSARWHRSFLEHLWREKGQMYKASLKINYSQHTQHGWILLADWQYLPDWSPDFSSSSIFKSKPSVSPKLCSGTKYLNNECISINLCA